MLKRAFDILAALIGLAILAFPAAIVWLIVKSTSKGPALYRSARVGKHKNLFQMPKFHTMNVGPLGSTSRLIDLKYPVKINVFNGLVILQFARLYNKLHNMDDKWPSHPISFYAVPRTIMCVESRRMWRRAIKMFVSDCL